MTSSLPVTVTREDLIRTLPYARRYARALTGSQSIGDELVAQSLRDILAGAQTAAAQLDARHMLYGGISARFRHADSDADADADTRDGEAQRDADPDAAPPSLSHEERQLLLLTTLEEVPLEAAASIVGLSPEAASHALARAREALRSSASTDVLIIEDEPIIAMDIEELVAGCGHRVVGVASTESEAVSMAAKERPGLILADINLGVGGDGAHAVARIMRHLDAPVIFVTAYPERLLTGESLEPAFIISKPFDPLTLAIATFQAVTGGIRLS